jgi:hypothetical protein
MLPPAMKTFVTITPLPKINPRVMPEYLRRLTKKKRFGIKHYLAQRTLRLFPGKANPRDPFLF